MDSKTLRRSLGMFAMRYGFITAFYFIFLSAHTAVAQEKTDYIVIYTELLAYHSKQPASLAVMKTNPYEPVPRQVLENLNPDVLKSHILKYVNDYINYKNRLVKAETDVMKMRRQIRDLPLTNVDQRPDLELAIAAQNKLIQDIPNSLFVMSMNANVDLAQSLLTLPPDKRVIAAKVAEKPKMPGVFGGSFEQRMKQGRDEKIFLTPVDNEFYDTQLGKKMERDFGGKAEYWSYNYDDDELYVRVKGDTSRVTVIKDQGGLRYIKTRSGADFSVIKGPDEKVDLLKAKGRFLTGGNNEEALFGDMPRNTGPNVIDERKFPPGHSANDGHDHSH